MRAPTVYVVPGIVGSAPGAWAGTSADVSIAHRHRASPRGVGSVTVTGEGAR